VLEVIAGRMDCLNRVLMVLQASRLDEWEKKALVDASQFMAEAVGAMADDAIGGDILGDTRRWFYGPLFADCAAKEDV
jgi:hypothetical protein